MLSYINAAEYGSIGDPLERFEGTIAWLEAKGRDAAYENANLLAEPDDLAGQMLRLEALREHDRLLD